MSISKIYEKGKINVIAALLYEQFFLAALAFPKKKLVPPLMLVVSRHNLPVTKASSKSNYISVQLSVHLHTP